MKKKIRLIKNKKSLSTIVITLIIVTLSLAAMTTVGIIVSNLLKDHAEAVEIQKMFLEENIDILSVRVYSPFVNLSLSRQTGEIKVTDVNKTEPVVTPADVDIMSVVDLSGSMMECYGINSACCSSMGGDYVGGNTCDSLNLSRQSGCLSCGGTWGDKLTPLKDANKNMISTLIDGSENRIGLVGYKNTVISSASANPTSDSSSLNGIVNSWTATSNTCICCGINDASDRLQLHSPSDKSKAIIVMSDGAANVVCSRQGTGDAKQDAIHAACDANSTLKNVAIWAVGVGTADTATLTSIAQCGGGRYFSVSNASELVGIYQTIAEEIEATYQDVNVDSYFSIVFYNSTDSYKDNIYDIPNILQTKVYSFDLGGHLGGEIIKIEVYPVIIGRSNKEVIGPLIASWKKE
jgi:hypothetical protein